MIAEIHYPDMGSRSIVHLPNIDPVMCGTKSEAFTMLTALGAVRHDSTIRLNGIMIERFVITVEAPAVPTKSSIDDEGWVTVTVPERFFWDHQSRALITLSGEPEIVPGTFGRVYPYVVKETAKKVTARLHPDDAADLFNDAEHYSNADMFEWELQGLVSSARATVYQMKKQLGW